MPPIDDRAQPLRASAHPVRASRAAPSPSHWPAASPDPRW